MKKFLLFFVTMICACSCGETVKQVPILYDTPVYQKDFWGNVVFKGTKKTNISSACRTSYCKCGGFTHFKPKVGKHDLCTTCQCSALSHGWENWPE
ncbi:MAG: hypothetical protein E7141_08280 [Rikenellaceae bacterium]|nr:hypothetical protein [Rikenellaceae bacterium]